MISTSDIRILITPLVSSNSSSSGLTVAGRVLLVAQALLTLPEHLSSPLFYSCFTAVRVTRSLSFPVLFCSLSFCLFSFGHWIACPSLKVLFYTFI